MQSRILASRGVAASVLGLGVLVASAHVHPAIPHRGTETLILLLADGPPITNRAPSTPPPGLAGGEVIVNSKIVPEVEIQGGLRMRPLYADSVSGASISVVDWPAEIVLRRHWHPVTERLWMIEGSIAAADGGPVRQGEFWEAPARVAMGPYTSTGSRFVFLGEGPFETYYLDATAAAPREGEPATVDPETIPWRPLADLVGGDAEGDVKVLRPVSGADRGVYLLRLVGTAVPPELTFRADLEGYVLSGSVRLSDPYHGAHVLTPGFYFRMPAGLSFALSSAG